MITAQIRNEEWLSEINDIVKQAEELTDGLSDEQFNWHPAPDRWSLAQIIDHLNIIARLTIPKLEEATAAAPKSDNDRPWSPSFLEKMFIGMLGPNPKFKSPVPPPFVPGDGGSHDEFMREFAVLHQRFEACVANSEGRDIKRTKVPSVANKMIKMSLGGWYDATIAHEQYHLGQAKSVRSEPGFPL